MDFNQFLLIIKARYKLIGIIFALIVILTSIFNILEPKKYQASTSLILNYKGVDPVTGLTLPAQLMPGYMATQIDIITSNNVAIKVVKKLNLSGSQIIKEQFNKSTNGKGDIDAWLAKRLLSNLEVKPSRESSVLEIIYTGTDQDFAALMANAFAEAYKETSVQLKIEPAKVAANFLSEQIVELRNNLEVAQSKLSSYQKSHGITNLNSNLDVESARLNELSTQLVLAQSQLYDSESRRKSSAGNSDTSPDVASNPLVQNLRVEVSKAEAKLTELSSRYGESHPQYIAAKAELNKQKSLLQQEIRNATNNIVVTKNIYEQREAEIKAALAAQKERVLKLNLARDELSVLEAEVENAQLALESASKRYSQTTQEGSSNQTDISILNPAIPPDAPSSPRVFLNIVLSIFIGLITGIICGVLVEMTNRKVRSKDDISRLLEIPVFGMINSKPKKNAPLLTSLPRRLLKSL